jgi:hypothetical protein
MPLISIILSANPLILKKIKEAYEITLLPVRLCISPIVDRQGLGKRVPLQRTHATIEELLVLHEVLIVYNIQYIVKCQ